MTHTKGPWETPGMDADGRWRVICATVNGRRRTVAHACAPYIDHDESGEERDANGHLIAAAPDLLEALEGLVNICTHPKSTKNEMKEARAAIAKAKGDES